MKSHPFDMTSFLFGVIFGGAAAVYLLADQLSWDIDGRWVLPAALIALGIAGIAGALSTFKASGREVGDDLATSGSGEPADNDDAGARLTTPPSP
ncbi:MAG TPA: hypothetical protein VMX11_04010 [Actinomycetes bacterium]|nr:hypothetical protein [Actinomycetes bacterium]